MKKTIIAILLIGFTMGAHSQHFTTTAYVDQDVSCYGNHDGYIQVNNEPAREDGYLFYCKKDRDTIVNKSGTFNHLAPGTYKVWVESMDGEHGPYFTLKVLTPKVLNVKFKPYKYPTIADPLGDLGIDITGGTQILQPYLVTWYQYIDKSKALTRILSSDENNMATYMPGVTAGNYKVIIEDDRGCFKTKDYLLRNKKK